MSQQDRLTFAVLQFLPAFIDAVPVEASSERPVTPPTPTVILATACGGVTNALF